MPEVKNPNLQSGGAGGGGGNSTSSTVLMWLVLLVGFLAYETFYNKPKPAPAPPVQTQQAAPQATPAAAQPQPASAATVAAAPATAGAVSAQAETVTTVENDLYRIEFSNRGAQVKHWILKKYNTTDGKPLDLIQPQAARFGLPLSYFTYDAGLTQQLNTALYQVTVEGGQTLGVVHAPATLLFHYAGGGVDAVKSIHFDASYVLDISTTVSRNGAPVRALVEWPAGLGDMEEFLPDSTTRAQVRTSAASQLITSINGKEDTTAARKVSGNATFESPFAFAGIIDLYFAAAFLPTNPERATIVTLHNTIDLPSNLSDPTSSKSPADLIGLAAGDTSGETHVRLYAGPKSTEVLNTVHAIGSTGRADGPSLSPLIQYGMWSFIAKPLYYALKVIRDAMGPGAYNWGWAIIVVTVIFNLAMMPTRFMMMRSSLKMMRIQPKVEAIKKRYANLKMNDPKRTEMNQEMMALYKTEGVNMYGSCLPMLVQMPLFLAYYRVLGSAIELRQAQWFWLHDLSMPDPLYILPILIIVSMLTVQLITPSPGMDPSQRRMMAIMMPAIFGFSMLHFASGLALYWGTGNVINLALQMGINRSHWGREMHAIAAKRAIKKAGGPKIVQGKR